MDLNLDVKDLKKQVDHINGNRNDNHTKYLRIVKIQQNLFNRTKAKGYRIERGKYRARITLNGVKMHLGYFNSPEKAR